MDLFAINKKYSTANNKGFTLVELAIVLLLIGFSITTIAFYYKLYLKQSRDQVSFENIRIIKTAIAQYYTDKGRYPCPTDPTLGPGDANFGVEMCPGRNVGGVAVPALAIGACSGGLCRVTSNRDIDGDGNNETVLIGAFPIRNINRDITSDGAGDIMVVDIDFLTNETLDAWGNKFIYAVTESLTDQTLYNNMHGSITIDDEFGATVINPEHSAHFSIVSLGENARGAHNLEGNIVGSDCNPASVPVFDPLAPAGTVSQDSIEFENCDGDSTFINALKYEVLGDGYNDDLVGYEIWQANELWSVSPIDPNNIYNVNIGNVGVGIIDPDDRLDIAGALEADDVLMTEICSTNGKYCFSPDELGGNVPECPNGEAMVGMEDGHKICRPLIEGTIIITGSCDQPGHAAVGITTGGELICKNFSD